MKSPANVLVVAALAVAVGFVLVQRRNRSGHDTPPGGSAPSSAAAALPRLVDLGAGRCIPCKAMAPILEELRKEQADQFDVVFIDVWENPDAAKPYAINLIPTQIFLDADGKELWRHEGFLSKDDILAKWREFGVGI